MGHRKERKGKESGSYLPSLVDIICCWHLPSRLLIIPTIQLQYYLMIDCTKEILTGQRDWDRVV